MFSERICRTPDKMLAQGLCQRSCLEVFSLNFSKMFTSASLYAKRMFQSCQLKVTAEGQSLAKIEPLMYNFLSNLNLYVPVNTHLPGLNQY